MGEPGICTVDTWDIQTTARRLRMIQEEWSDYYALLELYDPASKAGKGPNSTREEVKAARDLQLRAWHPDKFRSGSESWESANERAKSINEAYDVLSDPDKKKAYDGEWVKRNPWSREEKDTGASPPEAKETVVARVRPTESEDEAVGIPHKKAIRWWPLLAVIPLLVLVIYVLNQTSPTTPTTPTTPTALTTPEDPLAHLEAGRSYQQAGDLDKAIAELEAAVQADPTLTEAHFRLGNAYAEAGQLDKATEEFKAVLGLDDNDADAHSNLGVVYYQQGLLSEAASEFLAALEISPEDAEVHYLLGAAYVQMGRMDEGVKEFNAALEYNSDLPEAYFGLGTVYKLQGNEEEAIKAFERFLELGPVQDPQAKTEAEQLLRELKGQ